MTNWPYLIAVSPERFTAPVAPAGQALAAHGAPPVFNAVKNAYDRYLNEPQPAAQAMATPPGTCPPVPHCPTLPSSESAYNAVTRGDLYSWLKVGRDMLLRGALIWTGIAGYDAIKGRANPYRFEQAVAGAVGIEFFVLAWTWYRAPRSNP